MFLIDVGRSVVLDEMGDATSRTERIDYFSQFEARFSGSIDFEEYMNVSQQQNSTQILFDILSC